MYAMTTSARYFAVLCVALLLVGCALPKPPTNIGESPTPETPTNVWIMTDPDTSGGGDVDDVITLRLLERVGFTPVGVSTIAGNGDETDTRVATATLQWAGARYDEGQACEGDVTRDIIQQLERRSMIFLILGPATSLAAVLECRPDLAPQVEQVIFVGGRRPGEEFHLASWNLFRGMRDLNYEIAPTAFTTIARRGVPVDLVPFAAGAAVRFDPDQLAPHFDGEPADAIYTWANTLRPVGGLGLLPGFDVMAATHLLWPTEFSCDQVTLTIGDDLIVDSVEEETPWRLCLPKDPDRAHALVMDAFKGRAL